MNRIVFGLLIILAGVVIEVLVRALSRWVHHPGVLMRLRQAPYAIIVVVVFTSTWSPGDPPSQVAFDLILLTLLGGLLHEMVLSHVSLRVPRRILQQPRRAPERTCRDTRRRHDHD